MKALQCFKSEELHQRIAVMLYAAIYAEIYDDRAWQEHAAKEFNRLASTGDYLPRTFGCGGRLWLCYALRRLVRYGLVESTPRLTSIINRLFYREDITWDCGPDRISEIDDDVDGDSILMPILYNDDDSLDSYILRERMIAHLNKLYRLLTGEAMFFPVNDMKDSYLCSLSYFVNWCSKHNVYPFRTSQLTDRINELISERKESSFTRLASDIINHGCAMADDYAGGDDTLLMHLYLYDMPLCNNDNAATLSSPDEIRGHCGKSLMQAHRVFASMTSQTIDAYADDK